MTWCTTTQANSITNKTDITQAELDFAYQIVELNSNVTTDVESQLKPRDLRLLRQAEAFQTVWLRGQVDYLTKSDVDRVNQDGVAYSKADRDTWELGPLPKKCLLRLSWRQSRTMSPLTPEQALYLRGVRTVDTMYTGGEEWLDERDHWEPLP